MSVVTCDVVEAGATASDHLLPSITALLAGSAGYLASSMVWGISALLITSAVASDAAEILPVANVVERAHAADAVLPQAVRTLIIVEKAKATDAAADAPYNDVVEGITASDSVMVERSLRVTERALAAADALIVVESGKFVTERAAARDFLFGYNDAAIIEYATATGYAVFTDMVTVAVVETAVASDTLLTDIASDVVVREYATATASWFVQVDAIAGVIEYAAATDRLITEMVSLGWVANTSTFGMSRYTEIPFASMAVVNGRVLGLGATGLFEIVGGTDNGLPINAEITTGRSMLGTNLVKRVSDVYINGALKDEMTLSVGVYGRHKGTFSYTVPKRTSDGARGHKVSVGKGLSSVYWKFTVTNKNGADFDIDLMSADVAPSTNRRI